MNFCLTNFFSNIIFDFFRSKEIQEAEVLRDLERSKDEYLNHSQVNKQMEIDLEELRKHIELLNIQNNEVRKIFIKKN